VSDRPVTDIVLGMLRGPDNRVWAEIRPDDRHLAGALAFPGGKRDKGESLRETLCRELAEEVGVEVRRARRLIELTWDYPDRRLRLVGFEVTRWTGMPTGREGQQLVRRSLDADCREEWLAAMPPANRGLVNAMLLPRCMAITPPRNGQSTEAWFSRIEVGLAQLAVPMLINLRPADDTPLSVAQWQILADRLHAAGHWPLVNPGGAQAFPESLGGGFGLHLNHARLGWASAETVAAWQQQAHLVSAAVHDRASMERANRLGVDLVTVSPLRPTATHPGVTGMGWDAFAGLVEMAQMPVYALGGVVPGDLGRVWRRGGHGVASISAFW